jgi:hypothetical protein
MAGYAIRQKIVPTISICSWFTTPSGGIWQKHDMERTTLTRRTLEGSIFPAQPLDGGLIRFGVEELVQMRNNRHGEASLVITGSVKNRIGEAQRTIA